MRAGVAYCNASAAFAAGYQLARDAASNGGLSCVQLLLLFCGGNCHYQQLLAGARQFCGPDTQILGGSTVGIITTERIETTGYPAIAMALQATDVQFQLALTEQLSRDPAAAGKALAMQLANSLDPKLLLLFYDSVRYAGSAARPAVLNPSPPLLQSLSRQLAKPTPIAGAGLLADLVFSGTRQIFQHQVTDNAAMALQFSGNLKPYIVAMHGCEPLPSESLTISRSFGQFVYELNKQPVCKVLDRIIGHQRWREQKPVSQYALGMSYPPVAGQPFSTPYVARLINGVLPNDEGIILFEPDLAEGQQIQLLQRSAHSILTATDQQTRAVLQQIKQDGCRAVAAIYFDCAGRIHVSTPEAVLLQQQLKAAAIPLLGIYTGVEIAPVGQHSRSLDWSGVLVLLCQPAPDQA